MWSLSNDWGRTQQNLMKVATKKLYLYAYMGNRTYDILVNVYSRLMYLSISN